MKRVYATIQASDHFPDLGDLTNLRGLRVFPRPRRFPKPSEVFVEVFVGSLEWVKEWVKEWVHIQANRG